MKNEEWRMENEEWRMKNESRMTSILPKRAPPGSNISAGQFGIRLPPGNPGPFWVAWKFTKFSVSHPPNRLPPCPGCSFRPFCPFCPLILVSSGAKTGEQFSVLGEIWWMKNDLNFAQKSTTWLKYQCWSVWGSGCHQGIPDHVEWPENSPKSPYHAHQTDFRLVLGVLFVLFVLCVLWFWSHQVPKLGNGSVFWATLREWRITPDFAQFIPFWDDHIV